MCNFFSLISDGRNQIYYFDAEVRKKIIEEKLSYGMDSHTSIADYYGFKGEKEDKMNKYEYNPLTKSFIIDQINTISDAEEVEKICKNLDFKKIVPELIIKPIINPLQDIPERKRVTQKDIELLNAWASVCDSVQDSVQDSVWDSVQDSMRVSVWDSVWHSVWDSVRDSVWDSMRDSVWDSVQAYTLSFFIPPKRKGHNPFQSCIILWEKGLLPSFDGEMWRLHTGINAKIIYEVLASELKGEKK